MLDCYMSPKTMWEGVKTPHQVLIHTEDMHQEKIKVGPFHVSSIENERDLQLIRYVFEHPMLDSYAFLSPRSYLYQHELTTLRPQTHLDSSIIDIFADILTEIERKKSKHLNWYLPVKFSNAAINSADVKSFLDFVQRHNMRDNYMSDLVYCEKIFIPVHVGRKSQGHYYLYIIQMKNYEVEIWDSLCGQFMDDIELDQTTKKLLLSMDILFGDGMFTKFYCRMASNIPLQPNGYDCGIFVINYMQQLDNYVRKKPLVQFDSDEERLDLALKLLKSDLNLIKEKLYDEAARRHDAQVESEGHLNLCGIKRKRVDTCKIKCQDVGRGAHMGWQNSNNRVKRNNVDLKIGCAKGYKFPKTDLLGEQVQRYTQQIWEWIMNSEVSTIGIWGMGGVGKTTLATHVYNKLLEEAGDDFNHIIWVSVSQYNNSIYKLQKAIGRSISLDISDECDAKRISGKLLHAFKQINRCVLILDDVWDPFILEEVGFPVSNNGSKLILTSRSWEACQSMNCMRNIINVKPLDIEDGWNLFERTLGIHQIQSSEVEPIARVVANQCGGLPLAIVTIATSMKGKENIREWNHLLDCIQNLDNEQYDINKVYSVLKSSYSCLNSELRRFFLYYALSAKEHVNDGDIEPLIRRFLYERWTDEMKSLEMKYNVGYTMLYKLKNNSLLMEKNGQWRMHTLLRVLAITIARKTGEIMSEPCVNMKGLLEHEKLKRNLQKIFLTESNIQKLLEGTSPKCSKLSTLLLDCNYDLKQVPDDFFRNMPALRILDLSRTGIERLPESVSNLECLIALLLSVCKELSYVPSLTKLQRLIALDLSFTAIKEVPSGMELLVNLKCLNLEGTYKLEMSSSTISKMTNLQSLRLMNNIPKSMDLCVQDLQGLTKLEIVSANFCDIEEFNAFVKSFAGEDCILKVYCLSSAMSFHSASFVGGLETYSLKRVVLWGIDLENKVAVLPGDIKELILSMCDQTSTTFLCHSLTFSKNSRNLSKVEWLLTRQCHRLEYLCCVSPTCSFCSHVQFVRRLSLEELKDLKLIVAPFAPPFYRPFLYLRDIDISGCSRMRILMTLELLEQLQNLETIFVELCQSMEEIVGENHYCGNTFNPITLPKMRSMVLNDLPELTFVFNGTMLCPFLQYFEAYNCEKLRSAPHIEIREGHGLKMEKISTGYCWKHDNQQPPRKRKGLNLLHYRRDDEGAQGR